MKITNVSTWDENTIEVSAKTEELEETFYVQLTDNKYRSDLGCWITTMSSDGDISEDDYSDFDISEIIEAAEICAKDDFNDSFNEESIEFNCSINSCDVVMRVKKETEEVELVIRDSGYIGDYQHKYVKTGVCFDSKAAAEKYADTFRTEDYQDCRGLYAFMQKIQEDLH